MFDKTLWEQFKTNKEERRGIIILVATIIVASIGLKYFLNNEAKVIANDPATVKMLQVYYDSLEIQTEPKKVVYRHPESIFKKTNNRKKLSKILKTKIVLDYFDPNNADYSSLIRLGFSSKQANTIIKFRSGGFGFKVPEDLLKIYDIDTAHVKELIPYMLFPKTAAIDTLKSTNVIAESKHPEFDHKTLTPKSYQTLGHRPKEKIEINSATAEELKTIYGIGKVYAKIILKYRDDLGGYLRFDQIPEAFNFPDSTLAFLEKGITIDPKTLKKLNINEVTFKELVYHPYLSYEETQILFPFIENRRPIKDLNELDKILALDKKTLQKLKPYLSTQSKALVVDNPSN